MISHKKGVKTVYKKILYFLLFFGFSYVLLPAKAEAACTTVSSSKKTDTYYTNDYGSAYGSSYTSPSTPTLDKDVHDRRLNGYDFTSTYTKYYKTDVTQYKNWTTYTVDREYCDWGDGNPYYQDWKHDYTNGRNIVMMWTENRSDVLNANISTEKTNGSPAEGYEEVKVTAVAPNGSTASSTARSYYVNRVVVTSTSDKTYADEAPTSVTCTKYYGYGVGDNHSVGCTPTATPTTTSPGVVKTCYSYSENNIKDEKCSTSIALKDVKITAPSTSYTGKHQIVKCLATFADGREKDVEGLSGVLSSSPYNYIGDNWESKGYTDSKGNVHKPNGYNDFYPADNASRTYTINCDYLGKNAKSTINNIGIKQINISGSGFFPSGPNEYVFDADIDKTSEINGTFSGKFTTGHWYDFRANLVYNDGTTRDITSAPEVVWINDPWFPKQSFPNKAHSYDSNMPISGLNHRIPSDGVNTIAVEYFNKNVPYGSSSNSRNTMKLNGRQIQKLEIKDGNGYNVAPKTKVNAGDVVKYSAWITWTDGTKEDWTNAVNWSGDFLLSNGSYKFDVKSNVDKTHVSAIYNDVDRTSEAGISNWDSNYDKLEITIAFNCSTVTSIIAGCTPAGDNWQINPIPYFESTNTNFLPPPSAFGLKGPNDWNGMEEYPYSFNYKFNVSGISEGNGRK